MILNVLIILGRKMKYEIHGHKPVQPFIESRTHFVRYPIPVWHPMHGHVWEFYQYEVPGHQAEDIFVVPDACADILFCYDSKGLTSFIVGGPYSMSANRYYEKTTIFGIRFVTGYEFSVCEVPVHRYSFEHMVCRDINSKFRELDARMEELTGFEERVSLCEKELCSFLMPDDEVPLLVHFAVTAIINNDGNLQISRIADQSGYSERYIEQQFLKYIGIGPKTLSEIIRFQNSLRQLLTNPSGRLSDVAWDTGYYDLAHMNKSYKKMTSSLPRDVTKLFNSC